MKWTTRSLILLALITTASPSWGQESALSELRAAFQRLDYATADSLANHLLQTQPKLSPADIVEVHQILAIIAFTEGRLMEARQQFELALSIDPQLQLDPVTVSPKILSFLEEVRADYRNDVPANQPVHYRYLLVPDPRPTAALRSLIFPGLGQLYKGQTKRGLAMMAAAGSGAIATFVLHRARSQAERDYLAEQDIAKIPSRYDRFNKLNKERNLAALFTATVWVASFADALLSPANLEKSPLSVGVAPATAPSALMVYASLRF
jgi:tetratricopeptide (TPR) repeat protein